MSGRDFWFWDYANRDRWLNFMISDLIMNECGGCYSFTTKINFTKINYSKKLNPRISLDKLKSHLSKFTNVVDQRECFITNYKLNYE